MDGADIEADFALFPQVQPVELTAAQKKAQESERKQREKERNKPPTAAQVKETTKIVEKIKAESEVEQKAELIHKIEQFMASERLAHKLRHVKVPKLSMKTSMEDLKKHYKFIENALNTSGGAEFLQHSFETAAGAFQDFTAMYNPLKLAINGPVADLKGTVAANRDDFAELFEEISIKYGSWFRQSAERRLAIKVVLMIATVTRANSQVAATVASQNATASERDVNTLNDILK